MTNDQPALNGYCPVAYFVAAGPLVGSAEFASTHDGKTYHLVSADAKKMFDADPDKYVPAYGGACAFGMSVKEKFPVEPTNYKVVNDRLFLFLKNADTDALDLWNNENESEIIAKADTNFSAR
ncbi:YHS domain-containing (seleno)protein [Pelagibius sp. Alg239-R121]|uniref:YHS domain-containing (seleno)protein n=1 Tax=Pelagibius sp. Alg239-R121 TaxID=2993448 RepID=UPI0024A77422|nr:YHS domain-containing (seleno)protein [Pelagibius sp. Alg239-R121]